MEPNDPLWKLLGKSPRREPDGWFTARTFARCLREGTSGRRWGIAWVGWGWLAAGALAIALMVNVTTSQNFFGENVVVNENSAKVQDALNYLADRTGEVDLWSE